MKRLAVLVLAAIIFLAGCNPMDTIQSPLQTHMPSGVPVPGGSLSLPVYDFDTWNPIATKSSSVVQINTLIYEGLMKTSQDLSAEPCLAEGYSVSADGLEYTFFLRKGVVWHDGSRFSAQDVNYTLQSIMAGDGIYKKALENVASGRAADNNTYVVTLKEPMSGFLALADFPIIKSGSIGADPAASYMPMGTGPYKYSGAASSKIVRLLANGSWWTGTAANINEIVVKILPDRKSVPYAFEAREADAFTANVDDLFSYNPRGNAVMVPYTNNNLTFLGINSLDGVLSSVAVRKAVSAAVDRDNLVKNVMFDHAVASDIPVNPSSWLCGGRTAEPRDIEKSRQYLQADGWHAGDDGILMKKIGEKTQKLSFTILVNNDNQRRIAAANEIKKNLEEVGMSIIVQTAPFEDYEKRVASKDYAAFLGETTLPETCELSAFAGKDAAFAAYQSEQMDSLFTAARAAVAKQDIKDCYASLISAFTEEAPAVPLYFACDALVYNTRIKGDVKPVFGNAYANLAQWYAEALQ